MIIRKLTENDLPEVLTIEQATQFSAWTEDVFRSCLNAGYLGWVVEDAGFVLGFILVSIQANECHVLNFCIHPEHQHHGLGKQLLTHALTEAHSQGVGTAFLEVRKSNRKAIALYQNMGFHQIAEREAYYPAPEGREDAYIFAIDLSVTE